ncbi:MAG: MFS transporter [Oscillospiraceae bacterium]|jgi:oligogalacturonide transporter|nr:MFS transporter [Oscillospiraceae bacterium]
MNPTQTKERGLKKVWHVTAYAVGFALDGGVGQVLSLYYLYFLMYAMGLSPVLAGLVASLTKIWDGIIDPVIGLLVDKTNTKWGKCRPWLLASVVPVFITYSLLWTNLGIEGTWGKFFYFIFVYMLFSTASSIGIVPYDALLPRMIDDYNERTDYSSYRMIFSGIASVASTYIYEALIPVKTTADYANYTHNFAVMGMILGAMFAVPLGITFLGSKEHKGLQDDAQEHYTFKETLRGYGELLKSRLYRKCYAMTMLGAFNQYAIVSTLVIFVLLVYSNLNYTVPLLGTITLTFITVNLKGGFEIAFFVPNIIAMKKRSKHFPLLIDLPILAAGLIILLLITPQTPVWLFLLGVSLAGAGTSCLGFVPSALMPDLPDVDELIYGKRREGVSAGLVKMGKQVVQGLAFLIFSLLLAGFGLDESNTTPEQADFTSMLAVKLMLCVLPIACAAGMLLLSRNYKLNAESHAIVKKRIAQKREEGSVQLSSQEQELFADIAGLPYEELWIARQEIQPQLGDSLAAHEAALTRNE